MKKNVKLTLSYDGNAFSGWQRVENAKENKPSIQKLLEEEIERMTGQKEKVTGSGRTDAGVHALGQVANVRMEINSTKEEIRSELNKRLPAEIRVVDVEFVKDAFHSRYDAVSKTYLYRMDIGERESVFTRRYAYPVLQTLDVKAMRTAAAFLIGTHDFKAFSTDRKDGKSTVRTITDITILEEDNGYHKREVRIYVSGDGFLYHMVRIIAGTLLEVGLLKREPESVKEALEQKDRSLAGQTLSSIGLCLVKVEYE